MKTTPWYRSEPRLRPRPTEVAVGDADGRLAEPQFAMAVARWIA